MAAKFLLEDYDRVGSWVEVFKEDESEKDNIEQLSASLQEDPDDYANQELFPFMSNGSSTKVKIYKKKIPYIVYIEISCFPGPDCGDMGFYKLSMDNSCSKIYTIKLLNRIIS